MQFDVHRTRGEAARLAPYLVVLQADLLSELSTVVVAPLRPVAPYGMTMRCLHVVAEFAGDRYELMTEELVSLPRSVLGPRAGSLAHARQDLLAALDLLVTGF